MQAVIRALDLRITRRDALLSAAVAIVAAVTGVLVVRSPHVALAFVLLVLLLAVRTQSRTAGLATLWAYWLLAPFVRRLLDLAIGAPAADPLSLLPFLATGMLAVFELRENRLDQRARWVLAAAMVGLMLGAPAGLAADPNAGAFAAVAYAASLSAFVLGWGDGVRRGTPSLHRVLAVSLVPLALYGIVQYFLPLPAWDALWAENGQLSSLRSPQEGHIRVFATLNSPFTFAIVLTVGILLGLGAKRRLGSGLPLTLPPVVALALTFVRSAWLALVVALPVYALASRGRASGRVVVAVALCLVAVVVVGGSNPTTQAFTERVTSLGSPEEDDSANARLATTGRLLPASVSRPLGAGLGQAGLAVQLEESGGEDKLKVVDDGYLSLLYQVGPFGALLVLAGLIASVGSAVRSVSRASDDERPARAALLAALVGLVVALASSDVFFGLPGAMLWYLCGLAIALASPEAKNRRHS